MKKYILVFLVTLPLGCAYSSAVVKLGDNDYYVSGTAGSEMGGKIGAKREALQAAADHCKKLGKKLKVSSSSSATVNDLGTGSAEVHFTCD